MKYQKKYKEIMIPKGTLLFRYDDDQKIRPIMRFGFCSIAAAMIAPGEIDYIQLWIVEENIYGVYFVSEVFRNGYKINASDDAFKSLMGAQICPLLLPTSENPDREEFIDMLKNDFKINSWVTSCISKTEMELMLFYSENEKYVKFHSRFKADCLTMPDEKWKLYITMSFRHRKFTGNYFTI